MDFTRLQAFVEHLRSTNGMPHENILQAINHIKVIDRRIGQVSAIRGFIKPEVVNAILLEQTGDGLLFGERAV